MLLNKINFADLCTTMQCLLAVYRLTLDILSVSIHYLKMNRCKSVSWLYWTNFVFQEIDQLYTESLKKSVLDYILLDLKEQDRLKVCVPHKVIPVAV